MSDFKPSYIHIGFATILTLFVSICLIVFAALSILTSRSDLKLSQKYANRITHEYQADTTAKSFTKKIEDSVISAYQNSKDLPAFQTLCRKNLEALSIPSDITDLQINDADNYSLSVQFSTSTADHQQLKISLTITRPPTGSDRFIQIDSWNTSTDLQPETENSSLHLFEGNAT